MITVSDINLTLNLNGSEYTIDISLGFTGIRTSVYGKMYQYYMKNSGSVNVDIVGQDLLNDTSWGSVENLNDGFFRYIFIQGEVYDNSSTYAVGDVIYNTSLSRFEKCISLIDTPKNYDSSEWEVVNPEDSNINSNYKSTKDFFITDRTQKILLELREDSINEFVDSGMSDYKYGKINKLKKIESLYQAANDNFNQLSNKSLAQKYIEYIDIIN